MPNKSRKCKLTEATCKSAHCPAGAKRITLIDTKMPGLILRVAESGGRTFYVYRWFQGEPIKMKLGNWPGITLEQARDLCNAANVKIASDEDPRAERQAFKAQMTFGELWNLYLEQHAKPHKRSWRQDVSRYNTTLAHWANRKLSRISQDDVIALHNKLGQSRPDTPTAIGGQYSANRTLQLLGSMFSFAKTQKWPGDNPAKNVTKFPEHKRKRFLFADELPRFFAAMDDLVAEAHEQVGKAKAGGSRGDTRSAVRVVAARETLKDFVLLLLLTGARRRNVSAMSWLDVNLERGTWTIPLTKSGEDQTVVLTPDAMEVLGRRKKQATSQWVFPSTESASGHYENPGKTWTTLVDRAGLKDFRMHDLRRSLGSWMAAGNTSLIVIGKALGHQDGSTATRIYGQLELDPVRQAVNKATDAMMAFRKKA